MNKNQNNVEIAWNNVKVAFLTFKLAKLDRFQDVDLKFCSPIHRQVFLDIYFVFELIF